MSRSDIVFAVEVIASVEKHSFILGGHGSAATTAICIMKDVFTTHSATVMRSQEPHHYSFFKPKLCRHIAKLTYKMLPPSRVLFNLI